MSKKSNDNIEKFFQKAVAQQDTSHVDHDWANMEKLLDANTPRPQGAVKIKRTLILGTIVLLLLVPAALWWNYSNDEKDKISGANSSERFVTKKENGEGSISILPEQDGTLADRQKQDELSDTNLSSSSDVNTFKDEKRPAEGVGPQVVPSQKVTAGSLSSLNGAGAQPRQRNSSLKSQTRKKTSGSILSSAELPSDKLSSSQSLTSDRSKDSQHVPTLQLNEAKIDAAGETSLHEETSKTINALLGNTSLPSETVVTNALNDKQKQSNSNVIVARASENVSADPDSVKKVEEKQMADVVTENEIEEAKKGEENSDEHIQTRWSAIVSIAPDFSSTKVGRYDAPGAAFGFLVAFKPFKRWQIATGLYKSSKRYEGYGKEYQPPQGYWEKRTNGVIPDEIFGQCSILEWPILLRYNVAMFKKANVFTSIGVSSYRMTHERYKYTFFEENPGAATGWEATKPSEYRFSVGHISAGYERQLSPALSVILEPYVKIPFAGIGWSNISLHSTGVYFSMRYTLLRKHSVRSINLQTPVK